MGTALDLNQSTARIQQELKKTKESLFYSEDRVTALTEKLQERDKVGSVGFCWVLLDFSSFCDELYVTGKIFSCVQIGLLAVVVVM